MLSMDKPFQYKLDEDFHYHMYNIFQVYFVAVERGTKTIHVGKYVLCIIYFDSLFLVSKLTICVPKTINKLPHVIKICV